MAQKGIKIGIMSPYDTLFKRAREIAPKLNIELIYAPYSFQHALKIALKWQEKNEIEAIVSLSTAKLLQKEVNIPVVPIDLTNYDVIVSLGNNDFLKKKPVGFIDYKYRQPGLDLEVISSVLGIRLIPFLYAAPREAKKEVIKAFNQGIEVAAIIGDCLIETAVELGMKVFPVLIEHNTILRAFEEAVRIINFRRQALKFFDYVQPIVSGSCEPTMIVDNEGVIKFINGAAEDILGVRNENLQGLPMKNLPGWNIMSSFLKAKEIKEGREKKIINMPGKQLAVTCFNASLLGPTQGAIFTVVELAPNSRKKENKDDPFRRGGFSAKYTFDHIIGESEALRKTIEVARRYAQSEGSVLITGPSGTGKELFAQGIHNASNRRRGAFRGG